MRSVIGTPIDDTAKCGSHLNHGNVKVLSEGIGSQSGLSQGIRRINQRGGIRLSRKVNGGFISKAEYMLVLYKSFRPLCKGSIHHINVTGLHQSLLRIQSSMTVSLMTTDVPGVDTVT